MDLNLLGLTVPVSALNLFDTIVIIVLIPIFDKWLYPFGKTVCLQHSSCRVMQLVSQSLFLFLSFFFICLLCSHTCSQEERIQADDA